jgi:hypothetical protein
MKRSKDEQMTDVKKICVTVLEGLLANHGHWHHAPEQFARDIVATIVVRCAQGFGCDVADCEDIIRDTRECLLYRQMDEGGLGQVNVFYEPLPDFAGNPALSKALTESGLWTPSSQDRMQCLEL